MKKPKCHILALPNFNFRIPANSLPRVVEIPSTVKSVPEIEVITWVANQLSNRRVGGTFIDVGAHVGIYSIALVDYFHSILAFEPSPWQRGVLIKNVHRNGITNLSISDKAVGSRRAHQTLSVMGLSGGSNTLLAPKEVGTGIPMSQHSVEVVTIDELKITDLKLMKIDVEGFELEVLKGAKATLKKNRPILICEIWDRQPFRRLTLTWLLKNDYIVSFPFVNHPEIAIGTPLAPES